MTVEGYVTLVGYDTGKTIRTLMIADEWNGYVRYVNLDYTGRMDILGTKVFS